MRIWPNVEDASQGILTIVFCEDVHLMSASDRVNFRSCGGR